MAYIMYGCWNYVLLNDSARFSRAFVCITAHKAAMENPEECVEETRQSNAAVFTSDSVEKKGEQKEMSEEREMGRWERWGRLVR